MNIYSESDYVPYKEDQSKPRMELLPPDALIEISKVMTFGSSKYISRNWELNGGLPFSRLYAALQRHLNNFWAGQDYDEETNLPSLAHAGSCMLMLLAQFLRHKGADDRYKINEFIENNKTNIESSIKEDIKKIEEVTTEKKSIESDSQTLSQEIIDKRMKEILNEEQQLKEDDTESEDTINDDNVKETTYEKFKFNKREYMAIINHYTKPYKDFRIGYYVTIIDIKTKKVVHSFYSSKKLKKNTCMFELQKFVNDYVYRNSLYSIDDFNMDLDYNDDINLEEYDNEDIKEDTEEQVNEEVPSKYNDNNQIDIKEKNEEKAVHLTDSIEFDSWDKIRDIKLPIHVDIIYTRKNKQERYDYIYINKNTDKVLIQTYSDTKRSEQEIIDYYNYFTNLHLYPANNNGNDNNEEFNLVDKTNVIKENIVNVLPIYSEYKKKEITFFITYTNHNNIRTYTVESKYFPGTILKYRLTYDLTIDQLIINIKKSFRI